ncbi:MAG: flagellar basal body rod protein FlgF [Gammaproteobacteria bacterium]|nr:flagellar basal body rod protein FlgF [Gammaproteobacteria bacterium]NND39050.1 flagellar basal body rod protein FlgF [Pseudomonadales bacterium]MBT8151256.1 flagellar basal body rod protein FlgF [Gammaproteobacteria bacterium]NNL10965.1 flagellar basal body rod protein FlgF [Pseudomonadales bacterium]NNM12139.1 flagellar basal body rod protein FlgF [Pseudomonadales bacterium]
MDRGLFVSMTGAVHNMHAQTVHSNNLANAATTGFRADFVDAVSLAVKDGEGHKSRVYAVAHSPATDFRKGSMQATGRDLDIAINGEGWLAVIGPNGEEAFTRAGSLHTDAFGALRNERGDQVLGNGGPVVIPEAESIEIATDGTISVRALGQGPEALVEVDRLKLVAAAPGDLNKGVDGRFYAAGAPPSLDANIRVSKGFVESSNVNPVNELTQVMSLARQFEMQMKMMQTMSDTGDASVRLLQVQA